MKNTDTVETQNPLSDKYEVVNGSEVKKIVDYKLEIKSEIGYYALLTFNTKNIFGKTQLILRNTEFDINDRIIDIEVKEAIEIKTDRTLAYGKVGEDKYINILNFDDLINVYTSGMIAPTYVAALDKENKRIRFHFTTDKDEHIYYFKLTADNSPDKKIGGYQQANIINFEENSNNFFNKVERDKK